MSYLKRAEKLCLIEVIRFRDGSLCCWCLKLLSSTGTFPATSGPLAENYPTLEHIIKRADGGKNAPANLKLSCPSCNHGRDKREHPLTY